MFNKFKKTIHNKYSRFYDFIFFLRYLFIIFFISTVSFLSIPHFFDYEKKSEVIKLHLLENYDFKISNYGTIKYNIFPLPNLELTNVQVDLGFPEESFSSKKVNIYPNLPSIYNYENYNSKKIIFKDSNFKFQISNSKLFTEQLFYKKKKLYFNNLNLKIINEKQTVISLNNIKFANFGYNKNLISGKVFNKSFKVEIDDNFKNINFKLNDLGINMEIIFDKKQKKNLKLGTFKSKILNTNFRSDFEYDGKIIKIFNSYLRGKNLSFKNESEVVLKPFFDIKSKFIIDEFNSRIFENTNLMKILRVKDFVEKINTKSEISFKPKKFNRTFDDLNLKISLAYGRMNFTKRLYYLNNSIKCEGNINLLEEFPTLFFDCLVKSDSRRELLKQFSVKTKDKKKLFELKFEGNLNVLSRKINFKNISTNDNYDASQEDLKYFKDTFENILFDQNFIKIFDVKKIKEFIIAIS